VVQLQSNAFSYNAHRQRTPLSSWH
jgi:hypothetical protein